ncbi:hypothetical protein OESDEN_10368 [Oesophagostomum dentatum]|uniref:Uncharacterized protein n=1 Tax=Oesophagostomum dentatum TaxID=61180 RepID=A0A0B1SXU7_OESDE|nr:hypothetical protein OESDEN_10368 [Oesophagostomum dentatum]
MDSQDYATVSNSLDSRVKEMQGQVGTLAIITTITLLLALLMVILYILEMICGGPSKGKGPQTPMPTAVVIQPKEEKKKEEQEEQPKETPKEECRHTLNRHFPSKKLMLTLDVKKPDKTKKPKEKELKVEPVIVEIPVGAPPPYEAKKDAPAQTPNTATTQLTYTAVLVKTATSEMPTPTSTGPATLPGAGELSIVVEVVKQPL